jgi:hypothetical protein
MSDVFRDYIRMVIKDFLTENPRVSSQLVDIPPGKEKNTSHDDEENEIEEFSTVAGGSIQGFTLPLGMSPDSPILGSKKRKKSPKRKKPSWT